MGRTLLNCWQEIARVRQRPLAVICGPINQEAILTVEKECRARSAGKKLDIFLSTLGGDPDAAFILGRLFNHFFSEETAVLVPRKSKSAGTLICLAASKIYMAPSAELGPLDTQVRVSKTDGTNDWGSALDGFKGLEQVLQQAIEAFNTSMIVNSRFGIRGRDAAEVAVRFAASTAGGLYANLDPTKIGQYSRDLQIAEQYALQLLKDGKVKDSDQIVKKLVYSYPSHSFALDFKEVKSLGLPVELLDTLGPEVVDACSEAVGILMNIGESEPFQFFVESPEVPQRVESLDEHSPE